MDWSGPWEPSPDSLPLTSVQLPDNADDKCDKCVSCSMNIGDDVMKALGIIT